MEWLSRDVFDGVNETIWFLSVNVKFFLVEKLEDYSDFIMNSSTLLMWVFVKIKLKIYQRYKVKLVYDFGHHIDLAKILRFIGSLLL